MWKVLLFAVVIFGREGGRVVLYIIVKKSRNQRVSVPRANGEMCNGNLGLLSLLI